jgi:hypothetical protein
MHFCICTVFVCFVVISYFLIFFFFQFFFGCGSVPRYHVSFAQPVTQKSTFLYVCSFVRIVLFIVSPAQSALVSLQITTANNTTVIVTIFVLQSRSCVLFRVFQSCLNRVLDQVVKHSRFCFKATYQSSSPNFA